MIVHVNILKHILCYFLSAGEEPVNMEACKSMVMPSSEKIQFVDRLAISITKRKRSMPQKFLGELK